MGLNNTLGMRFHTLAFEPGEEYAMSVGQAYWEVGSDFVGEGHPDGVSHHFLILTRYIGGEAVAEEYTGVYDITQPRQDRRLAHAGRKAAVRGTYAPGAL